MSVSTHDLPTLAGFWQNRDIEIRRQTGILPDEQSYQSQLRDRVMEKQKLLDLFHRLQLLPEWFPSRADEVPEFTGELHYAAIGFLSSTPSVLMVLNQEDLFKDTDQQNMPGTTEQYPNWRAQDAIRHRRIADRSSGGGVHKHVSRLAGTHRAAQPRILTAILPPRVQSSRSEQDGASETREQRAVALLKRSQVHTGFSAGSTSITAEASNAGTLRMPFVRQ